MRYVLNLNLLTLDVELHHYKYMEQAFMGRIYGILIAKNWQNLNLVSCQTLNVAIRKVFNVPFLTHCRFLSHVSQLNHVTHMLKSRKAFSL